MQANEQIAYAFTFKAEGDDTVSLDPDDKGNWSQGAVGRGTLIGTKFGVSAPVLMAYYFNNRLGVVTPETMAELPQATADIIIATQFWNPMNCDSLPGGADLSVNDHGFNAGTGTSVKILQHIVGAVVDGGCGDKTLAAVAAWDGLAYAPKLSATALLPVQLACGMTQAQARGGYGPETKAALAASAASLPVTSMLLCAALFDGQMADYIGIGNPKYIDGWTNRANARLAAAVALAVSSGCDAAMAPSD